MKIQQVVSIERNEVILDRETLIEQEHIDLIVDSGAKPFCFIKKIQLCPITP